MKKLLFFFLLIAGIISTGQAKIYVVSNESGKPAQFSDIASAMKAASKGDTIYVNGSAKSYGDLSVTKPLTFIGQGHHPANPNQAPTTINNLDIYTDHVTIIGFYINNYVNYTNQSTKASNIDIERCYVSSTLYIRDSSANWLLANNVLYRVTGAYSTEISNILILNNVFTDLSISGFDGNIVIKNNLFLQSDAFGYVNQAVIANNIFYGGIAHSSSIYSSSFNNNLTRYDPDKASPEDSIPYGSNSGSGNFVSKDPGFVKIDKAHPYSLFSTANDYHLKSTSIGYHAGTDGTDIGPFGGSKPMPTLGGDPPLPMITQFDIDNVVVPQNGKLNMTVKVKRQQ